LDLARAFNLDRIGFVGVETPDGRRRLRDAIAVIIGRLPPVPCGAG
jgi:hypothetical protein